MNKDRDQAQGAGPSCTSSASVSTPGVKRDRFELNCTARRQLSSKTRTQARSSFRTCAGRACWTCRVQARPQDKDLRPSACRALAHAKGE